MNWSRNEGRTVSLLFWEPSIDLQSLVAKDPMVGYEVMKDTADVLLL